MNKALPPLDATFLSSPRRMDHLLEAANDDDFEDYAHLAGSLCECPIALVGFLVQDRFLIKSRVAPEVEQGPFPCCLETVRRGLFLEVPDTDSFVQSATAESSCPAGVRFYAGAPLFASSGEVLGAICVMDYQPRRLSPEQRDSIQRLGRRVMKYLDLRLAESVTRQFKETLDEIHDCVFIFDPDTLQFVYVNESACTQVGYSERELLRMHPYDIKPEYPEAEFRSLISPLLEGTRQTSRLRTNHRHKEGWDLPVEVYLQLVRPPGENPRFVAIVQDISARIAAERDLLQYKALANLLKDPLYVIAPSEGYRFHYVNRAACDHYGLPERELLTKTVPDLDPNQSPETMDQIWRQIQSKGRISLETVHKRADGQIVPVQVTGSCLELDGGRYIGGFIENITERKEAEQRRAAHAKRLRRLSEFCLRLDNEKPETIFEPIVRLIAEEMQVPVVCISEPIGSLLHSRSLYVRERIIEDFTTFPQEDAPWRTMLQGQEIQVFDHVQERFPAVESFRRFEAETLCGFSTRDEQGQVITVAHLLDTRPREFHDEDLEILRLISQRLSLELDRLKRFRERAEAERIALRAQRMESIGTLAGGVAHDLNNALAPVLLSLEMLKSDHPQESETLNTVCSNLQRAGEMVRQLLTFAKGAPSQLTTVHPEPLIQDFAKFLRSTFPKNIEVNMGLTPNLPPLLADPTHLHQILLNLCVNSRDAMPDGGTLTIEARVTEIDKVLAASLPHGRTGRFLELRISDTGAGIPTEMLDRIFDPFFSTKDPDKGTGLGLSTTLGLVKSHGGFLDVQSQPERGSVFLVYLPVQANDVPPSKASPEINTGFRGNGETILVVDDAPAIRSITSRHLRRLNFTTLTATDGLNGLEVATEHRDAIKVVIADLQMPHMDGLQFVQALRRMLPTLPVIVTSGRISEAQLAAFRDMGRTERLDKPFTAAKLTKVLQKLL